MNEHREMVPLFVSPERLSTLFFGGGGVAMRKAEHFQSCAITVVAEKVLPELEPLASRVLEQSVDEDALSLIRAHDVVVAATDDKDLNDAIVQRAKGEGKLVNSVHGGGNFLIPSMRRRDGFVLCASTEGRAPVLPPFLMERSDELYGPSYESMARLLEEMRPIARQMLSGQKERAGYLRAVMRDEEVWGLLTDNDHERARDRAMRILEDGA